jgi:hypothetical protein
MRSGNFRFNYFDVSLSLSKAGLFTSTGSTSLPAGKGRLTLTPLLNRTFCHLHRAKKNMSASG